MVVTLPPIPGQVPSATGERRKVGKTIDERSYPDEDSEEAGMEFITVVGLRTQLLVIQNKTIFYVQLFRIQPSNNQH